MILDHSRSPRNFGPSENQNLSARGYNPLCGDEVEIHLYRDGDSILREISFEGCGCAISTASASILSEVLKGRSEAEVREIFAEFRQMVTGEGAPPSRDGLMKLQVFGGVKEFPSRPHLLQNIRHRFQFRVLPSFGADLLLFFIQSLN